MERKVGRPPKKGPKVNRRLVIYCNPEEFDRITKAAEDVGIPVSAWCRRELLLAMVKTSSTTPKNF